MSSARNRVAQSRADRGTSLRWLSVLACMVALGTSSRVGASDAKGAPGGKEIVLGMSTALTGTAASLGKDMRAGVEAALAEANRNGGINGRTVRLSVLDDGYEPSRTAPNMKKLLNEENVLGIVGNVGTPTAVVAMPIAEQSGAAFFGAFTGAGVLRKTPPGKCVMNYRAGYSEETAALVGALIDHAGLKPDEIAFFTQRDAYGDAGYSGGIAALKTRGLKSEAGVAHGRYERNTLNVDEAVAELLGAAKTPKAIIMVGTAQPSADFVRLARKSGLDVPMLSVSFVGASAMASILGKDGEGVYVSRVVPHQHADIPIIREFRAAVTDESQRSSEVVLEGYIVGRIVCRALSKMPGEPSRAALIGALEGMGEFDLGLGAPLRLSPTEHQACHRIWATRLHDGKVEAMEWTDLKASPAASTARTGSQSNVETRTP